MYGGLTVFLLPIRNLVHLLIIIFHYSLLFILKVDIISEEGSTK